MTQLLPQETCNNCAVLFYPIRVDQRFCKPKCHRQYNTRQSARGRVLVEHAMLWRLTPRDRSGCYLTEMSRLIDKWLEQDRKRMGTAYEAKRLRKAEIRRDLGRALLVDL